MSPIPTTPIRWPAEAIREAVAPALPGFTVEVLPSIDSSNTELMRRFRAAGAAGPTAAVPVLLVAEQQTAGRGRMGRSWQSRAGDSLTFSLGMPLQPADWSGLSLAVGISIAESLEPGLPGQAGQPHIRLKWPNDLWLIDARSERKLAGILVETASWGDQRYVVIGVGLNVRPLALADAAPAAMPPAALQDLLPGMDVAQALQLVAAPLVQAVQAFGLFGFAPFQARFAARDALAGRAVHLSDGTEGVAHGVGENGALLVHTPAGMQEITSSEVSVRPVAAALPTRPC